MHSQFRILSAPVCSLSRTVYYACPPRVCSCMSASLAPSKSYSNQLVYDKDATIQ